jgi:hypothetical protein
LNDTRRRRNALQLDLTIIFCLIHGIVNRYLNLAYI